MLGGLRIRGDRSRLSERDDSEQLERVHVAAISLLSDIFVVLDVSWVLKRRKDDGRGR